MACLPVSPINEMQSGSKAVLFFVDGWKNRFAEGGRSWYYDDVNRASCMSWLTHGPACVHKTIHIAGGTEPIAVRPSLNYLYRQEDCMAPRTVGSVALSVLLALFLMVVAVDTARCEEPAKQPARVAGYLSARDVPDSIGLIPAPPAAGSPAFVLDEQVSKKTLTMRGTQAWELATRDADLNFPHVVTAFTCALDAPITEKDTPRLYLLMRRSFVDASSSTFAAKDKYARPRPFMVNKQPTCSPDEEARMTKSGSYPSGHSALGWAWALILSEVAPDRTNAILSRGRAYAQGRTVCNVHWQSDIIEGMIVGSAAVARMHGSPEFLADVQAAKGEVADVRSKGSKPTGDCKLEAVAETVRATQLP
jgi:acid phosphatase (class A)